MIGFHTILMLYTNLDYCCREGDCYERKNIHIKSAAGILPKLAVEIMCIITYLKGLDFPNKFISIV